MRAKLGAVFSAKDFSDLGGRAAVDQALSRGVRDGTIRRVGRGLYDIPRKSPLVGTRAPSLDSVAAAVARKSAARVAPTGAQAANLFGLSTQVPASVRYLTDRTPRLVHVGKRTIRFDRVVPRRLAGDPTSHAVIEALRYVGNGRVTVADADRIRHQLPEDARRQLAKDMSYAPDWMRPWLDRIAGPDSGAGD